MDRDFSSKESKIFKKYLNILFNSCGIEIKSLVNNPKERPCYRIQISKTYITKNTFIIITAKAIFHSTKNDFKLTEIQIGIGDNVNTPKVITPLDFTRTRLKNEEHNNIAEYINNEIKDYLNKNEDIEELKIMEAFNINEFLEGKALANA